jgi:hypothetical protein
MTKRPSPAQHYLKKEFFIAQNVHELKIQLKMFQFIMELRSVHWLVVMKGVQVANHK